VDIVLQGMVFGVANGLLAAGIVLVYMSNRTINFAQGELGAFAVAVMFALSNRAHFPYAAALACALAATAVLGALVELTVIRRLFTSPRLIVLIATIGVAQVITALRAGIPKPRNQAGNDVVFGGAATFPVPFHLEPITFGRVVFHSAEILVLTVGPLLALALFAFLRWSRYGVALRASAENAQRARLLGIPVRRVSTMAWVLAALFSGVAAILLAPVIGYSSDSAAGLSLLFRGLAAATIAGLSSVGVAFGVGIALGVADELIFVWTGQGGLTDLVLLLAVVVALLTRKDALRRAASAAESAPDTGEPIRPLPLRVLQHPAWSNGVFLTKAVGAGVLVLLPFVLSSHNTYFIAATLLMCTATVSVTILTGWAGQLSLGQWAIAGLGGLLAVQLYGEQGVPFWVAFALSFLIGAALAALIGLPALRLHGVNLAVVTLAFAVTCGSWLYQQSWARPDLRIQLPAYLTTRWQYALALALLLGVLATARLVERSQLGRAIRAVKENPVAASSMGISVVRTKLTAFALTGAMAGGTGFLFIDAIGSGDPAHFPTANSLALLAAAVIGGLGSLTGALVGGVYIFAVQYFAAQWFPEHADVISLLSTGVGLLALLLYMPGGLIRPIIAGRDRLARALTGIDPREAIAVRSTEESLNEAARTLAATTPQEVSA
jgi:ABC-type branched-subunit amino acid transport system permease subunit